MPSRLFGGAALGFASEVEKTDENYWCAESGPRQDLLKKRALMMYELTLKPYAKQITEKGE